MDHFQIQINRLIEFQQILYQRNNENWHTQLQLFLRGISNVMTAIRKINGRIKQVSLLQTQLQTPKREMKQQKRTRNDTLQRHLDKKKTNVT